MGIAKPGVVLVTVLLVLVGAWSEARALPAGVVLERVEEDLVIGKRAQQDRRLTTEHELVLHFDNRSGSAQDPAWAKSTPSPLVVALTPRP